MLTVHSSDLVSPNRLNADVNMRCRGSMRCLPSPLGPAYSSHDSLFGSAERVGPLATRPTPPFPMSGCAGARHAHTLATERPLAPGTTCPRAPCPRAAGSGSARSAAPWLRLCLAPATWLESCSAPAAGCAALLPPGSGSSSGSGCGSCSGPTFWLRLQIAPRLAERAPRAMIAQ